MREVTKAAAATPEKLMQQARDIDERVETSLRATLADAMEAGELLTKAKNLVRHGDWLEYVERYFRGDARRAQQYMRLAEGRKLVQAAAASMPGLTIKGALKLLKPPAEPEEKPSTAGRGAAAEQSAAVSPPAEQGSSRDVIEDNKAKALAEVAKGTPGLADKIGPGKDPEPAKPVAGDDPFAEAAPEPEPAPASVPVEEDAEGNPLPERAEVRAAFAGRAAVREALNAFDALKKAVNLLWLSPAAGRMSAGLRQQVNENHAAARRLVHDYQPHAVCPECGGKREDDCPTCGGHGYVTREGWKRFKDGAEARRNIAARAGRGKGVA